MEGKVSNGDVSGEVSDGEVSSGEGAGVIRGREVQLQG